VSEAKKPDADAKTSSAGFGDYAFFGLTAVNTTLMYVAATAAAGALVGYGMGKDPKDTGRVAAYFGLAGALVTGWYAYKQINALSAKADAFSNGLADTKQRVDSIAKDIKNVTAKTKGATDVVSDIIQNLSGTDVPPPRPKFQPSF
jgi:hypothetical protein